MRQHFDALSSHRLNTSLGSTKVVLNAATGVTNRMVGLYEYSPFGEVVYSQVVGSVVCDFTYTGQVEAKPKFRPLSESGMPIWD